jgi:hypothetical protein
VVITRGGSEAAEEGLEHTIENRGSKIGSSAPGCKGDTVRARCGIVGGAERAIDRVEIGSGDGGGVNPFGVSVKELICRINERWGAGCPDLGPKAEGNCRLVSIVRDGRGIVVEFEEGETRAGGGKLGRELLSGVRDKSRGSGGRGGQEVAGSIQKPVISPNT